MSERLDLLRPYLKRFKRRFALIDVGSGIEPNQNIGQEIAREFNAVCVSIEKDWTRERFEPSRSTMVLKRAITVAELQRLSECEYFDVGFALNILHWFRDDWRELMDTVMSFGRYSFIQVPDAEDITAPNADLLGAMNTALMEESGDLVGRTVQFEGHRSRPMYGLVGDWHKHLTRTNWEAHDNSARTLITACQRQCKATLKGKKRDWIPGVNLWNFCNLGGVWPTRDAVVGLLEAFPLPTTPHGDIAPHNFIFDGEALHLIDGDDGWYGHASDREAMDITIDTVARMLK